MDAGRFDTDNLCDGIQKGIMVDPSVAPIERTEWSIHEKRLNNTMHGKPPTARVLNGTIALAAR
jgi:hypothetical protein